MTDSPIQKDLTCFYPPRMGPLNLISFVVN